MKITYEQLKKLALVYKKPTALNPEALETWLLDEIIKLVGEMRNATNRNYHEDTSLEQFKKDAVKVAQGYEPKQEVTFERLHELLAPLNSELSKDLQGLRSTPFDKLSKRTVLLLIGLTTTVYKYLHENFINDAPIIEFQNLFNKLQAETEMLEKSNPEFNTIGHHKSQLGSNSPSYEHHLPSLR